ncbi:MAG: hypothetical protein OIF50_03500 [Flavobacteriaceae bacterium]|nr:hypothetical protein [Flavobacteriaceae bacterium]
MQNIWVFIFLCLLASCNSKNTSTVQTEAPEAEIVQRVNWIDVDRYPKYGDCSMEDGRALQRECFETQLTAYLYNRVIKTDSLSKAPLYAVAQIRLEINEFGELKMLKLSEQEEIADRFPHIRATLEEGILALPKMEPARKKSKAVITTFRLALIFNID